MITMGNYKAERTSAGLLIRDVEISRETSKIERPDFLRDLDVTVFERFIHHFNRRVAQKKVGAFVLLDHEGPGVGRIESLRIEDKQLVADLLITNETVISMVERGELTERSIEWAWSEKDARLKGVALLSGKFGQDSEGWADLTVDYTQDFIKKEFSDFFDNSFCKQVLLHTLTTDGKKQKGTNMALGKEDLEALSALIDSKIEARLTQFGGVTEADPVNEQKVAEALARIQKKERDITITGFVETLARKGYSNKKNLRASFEKFGDNIMAMEVEFKRLMEKADEDVKLEMEEVYEKPSLEVELAESFKIYKENYPASNVTLAEFKAICKGENKADPQFIVNKKVIEVL